MKPLTFIGIDVSKGTLAIWIWGQFKVIEIANKAEAILKWLATLPEQALIGMEPTSTYHSLVANLCVASGHTVFLLQPRDMCHYRRTVSPRAKTDRLDAEVLARYVSREYESLRPWKAPTEEQRLLDVYLSARAFSARQRTALDQLSKACPDVSEILNVVHEAMNKAITAFDRLIQKTAKRTPELADGYERIQAIDGVGPLVGAALGNLFSKYDFESSDAVVAFVGMDPRPMESGKFKGRRKLSKRGPSEIRRLLYNGAMAGSQEGKAWEALKAARVRRGDSKIAANCIVARKILRTAWAIWNRPGTTFEISKVAMPELKAA